MCRGQGDDCDTGVEFDSAVADFAVAGPTAVAPATTIVAGESFNLGLTGSGRDTQDRVKLAAAPHDCEAAGWDHSTDVRASLTNWDVPGSSGWEWHSVRIVPSAQLPPPARKTSD